MPESMSTAPGSARATPRRWLLIHGTPLTPEVWTPTADALGTAEVLAPDCTDVPTGDNPQAAIARRLLESVDGDLDVVGHPFGGQIAIEVALRAPQRVRTLTILCSRDTPFPAFGALAESVRAGDGRP